MVVDVLALLGDCLVAQNAYHFNIGIDVIVCLPSCSSSSFTPRDVDILGRVLAGGTRLFVIEQRNNFLFCTLTK